MATVDPMRRAEGSISERHLGLDLGGHSPPDPIRRAEGDPVCRSLTIVDREWIDRENRRLARLLRGAKLPMEASLEDVWCKPVAA
jgi:hypothetical protein